MLIFHSYVKLLEANFTHASDVQVLRVLQVLQVAGDRSAPWSPAPAPSVKR